MVLDRTEFADHFNSVKPGLGDESSPLWAPEEDTGPLQWFVCVEPLSQSPKRKAHEVTKDVYWAWCNENLVGTTRCYSSDYQGKQEWWGFSDKQDIVLWTLKWT